MAGIEEAFEKFVTRVSGRERSPAEQPLSKYKSYSEQELLENIEAKYPNQLQSFSQEDYQLNTMPMFEPKDVAPYKSYSPMPVEKYLRGRDYMDLAQGGVASMFRERPEYSLGGPTKAIRKKGEPTQQESAAGLGIAPSGPVIDVSTNPIAKSLEMAGFTREEIMRIIGERGYADGGLTKTVPPAKGPNSQGVETLFRRRYS